MGTACKCAIPPPPIGQQSCCLETFRWRVSPVPPTFELLINNFKWLSAPRDSGDNKKAIILPAEESQTAKCILQYVNRLSNCSLKLFFTEIKTFQTDHQTSGNLPAQGEQAFGGSKPVARSHQGVRCKRVFEQVLGIFHVIISISQTQCLHKWNLVLRTWGHKKKDHFSSLEKKDFCVEKRTKKGPFQQFGP